MTATDWECGKVSADQTAVATGHQQPESSSAAAARAAVVALWPASGSWLVVAGWWWLASGGQLVVASQWWLASGGQLVVASQCSAEKCMNSEHKGIDGHQSIDKAGLRILWFRTTKF